MWSIPMIIGVAVASGFVMLATGIVVAVKVERRRSRHFLQSHGLTRGLSTYHRPKLSVNEDNYSNVTLPTASLRRSVQLPDGSGAFDSPYMASGGHGNREPSLMKNSVCRVTPSPEKKANPKRPFSEQQLYIPKTRRQKKLRKAISMNQSQQSPLSVIAEFMDSKSSVSSIVAHLPNGVMATMLERDIDNQNENRTSIQWPLPNGKRSSVGCTPTEVATIAARKSVLMRLGGVANKPGCDLQFTAVPRSQSLSSTASSAPDDPLPPLPTIETYQQSKTQNLRTKASNTSLETVGSSVLGTIMSSPSNVGTELTVPSAGLDTGFSTFDFGLKQKLSTPRLQVPPVKRTIHGLCASKSSIRSLHPSVDMDGSSPESVGNPFSPRQHNDINFGEDSLKVIDASTWEHPLPLRINKTRSEGAKRQRHSMYEPSEILEWRAASDSVMSTTLHRRLSTERPIVRPASVANTNLSQWGEQGKQVASRHSFTSLDGHKRGHRRQNCVRTTNLPKLDKGLKQSRISAMPQVQEEQPPPSLYVGATEFEQSNRTSMEISKPKPMLTARPSPIDIKISPSPTPSPFRNFPLLTPSTRPTHWRPIHPPSSVSSGTPRPDSDVFNSTHVRIVPSSNYAKSSPRHWPLSPTSVGNHRLNDSPTPIPKSEYQPSESPMLPSPAFSASSLYPRKSLVKGPRNPRGSAQHFKPYCASPLQHKQGNYYRISKERDSYSGEIDLRRSVMMLRSMNSEGRLLDDQSRKIYRSVGDPGNENGSMESLKLSTPPMNKRVSGLRNSSFASSITAVSPTLDRQIRGPSPLAFGINLKSNRDRNGLASNPLLTTHGLHPPTISASPSAMSIGAISIWEDASVRADSPEPEVPAPRTTQIQPAAVRKVSPRGQAQYRPTPAISRGNILHSQNYPRQQIPPPQRPKTPTRIHLHRLSDVENSNLVQRLERVVSNGQWDGKRNGSGANSAPSGIVSSEPGLEIGLGLWVGNTRLGEPDFALRTALFA